MYDIEIFHDSWNLKYRAPFGAIELGDKVSLSISSNKYVMAYVHLNLFNGEVLELLMRRLEDNNLGEYIFNIEIDTTKLKGIVNYYFKIIYNNDVFYYGNNSECLGGAGSIYEIDPKPYQITVYKKRIVPNWYKEGLIYQIFVDRFFNGNDNGQINKPKKNSFIYGNWNDEPMYIRDGKGNIARWDFYGGNLKGIIKKLQYIKSLGVSIIYMNPIFEAVSSHKYDTGDYEKIDEMFGSEEDFKILCEEANKLGIKIILDGVFSHTGSDSKYFNKYGHYEGLGAYQSKDSKYYNWYRFKEYPDKYECWWGFDNQPNIEELNNDYVNYIIKSDKSIISKWMLLGASGWRLDVADELPDEFIAMIKEKMLAINNDSVLIGEVWEDASNKVSYSERRRYFFGEELDSVTNYPLRDIIIKFLMGDIKAEYFTKRLVSLYENYPIENFYSGMNLLGNHDTERILTILNEDINLLTLALVMQMTLPGVPLIYYGDEAGLKGGRDPENRKTYPWGNENKEILSIYKSLGNLRYKEEILKKGELKVNLKENKYLVYERVYRNEKITIILNPYNQSINYKVNESEVNYYDLKSTQWMKNENKNLVLDSYGFKIFKSNLR
ncbi:glycoside hydrolase family 13 protein [Clostridium chauvoei]|uniref:Glycoside hydrolase family 13 protein n=2 Tax=Clostridium chauvoei TaxID=46867 RepID=A0ABD4RKF0_9CLOT|nr:glycoside hydrolase family 13 protein [Clostridium chauvoei]ATD54024.1 alpha-glycosidase [Clostridium chauvoei]ATD58523.1 alpha-glycosidase [Clostridium chauvoei]MBX7281812.1 glycoside hydrolase family 13 protein [Clostridium chauvoei]MBX7284333.1 glycoside hydrolase family 13 protein [Clostridium chauvoei]MBX7286841.1 glycoside hydrolase family 13 protein [Clostridium chauvoei]